MEEFKIENFKKDNPLKDFPVFNTLPFAETKRIHDILLKKVKSSDSYEPLANVISKISTSIEDIDAINENFILSTVFNRLNICPNEKIYINWYHFDDIDEMRFSDFNEYFFDIWYPSSDDIDIFDGSFSWMLSISHSGTVKFCKIE